VKEAKRGSVTKCAHEILWLLLFNPSVTARSSYAICSKWPNTFLFLTTWFERALGTSRARSQKEIVGTLPPFLFLPAGARPFFLDGYFCRYPAGRPGLYNAHLSRESFLVAHAGKRKGRR